MVTSRALSDMLRRPRGCTKRCLEGESHAWAVNCLYSHFVGGSKPLLPHGRVTEYLIYKLKEVGIEVKLIDESYTSVTDSCEEVGVTKESKGNGRREKRGLFYSPIKGYINADVNGARNILRKFKRKWFDLVTGLKKGKRSQGVIYYQLRLTIQDQVFVL